MADMCRKGLHEMTEGNLIYEGNTRRCMACRRQWSAAYYAEHRERILGRQRQDREKAAAARPPRTHCRNGHPITDPEATYEKSNGSRGCRKCQRAGVRRYLERQRSNPEWYEHQRDRDRKRYASDAAYRERVKADSARRRARIMADPVLRAAERERQRVDRSVRYATDADYRERMRADALARYHANRAANARTITIPANLGDAVKRLGGEA